MVSVKECIRCNYALDVDRSHCYIPEVGQVACVADARDMSCNHGRTIVACDRALML